MKILIIIKKSYNMVQQKRLLYQHIIFLFLFEKLIEKHYLNILIILNEEKTKESYLQQIYCLRVKELMF